MSNMPYLNSDQIKIVRHVIQLALRIDRNAPPADMGAPLSQERLEAQGYIDALPDADKAMLIALMALGRGDAEEKAEEFPKYVEEFLDNTDAAGSYLISKVPIVEYWQEGLRLLNAQ